MLASPARCGKSARRASSSSLRACLALTCALGLVSCLWRTRWSFTAPCVQWPRAMLGRHASTRILRHASPEEDKVLQLAAEYPSAQKADADDLEEMVRAANKLMSPFIGQAAYGGLPGDWKVEWSTVGGRAFLRPGEATPEPTNLQLLSFLAIPKTLVRSTGSYNRIDESMYQLVQTFTMLDTPGGTEAAMVLEGPWSTGTAEGAWGKGAERTRVPVQFKTVRVVPSAENTEESRAMIEKLGLGDFLERKEIEARETYIDLNHMSPDMRIHKGASGAVYVLSKMEQGTIPFLLD
eukprot:TRINITY_DN102643_c0_g1_i1.p1 TRINITY_DN102643_c0_g1~~TRINITY_DN102643_c0_g1_i1.p1  ORF type:complete len:294 (-),score=63.34 TRINITY_DN102643_c0_g1_i1:57-938(-)